MSDTDFQAALLLGENARSDKVRGTRLAALQTALVKAASEENLRRTLVFHNEVKEAEAFAAGLPAVAAQLRPVDEELYPKTVWADWLCGEHASSHRRRVLTEFADGIATGGTVVEKGFLSSVKVLGEGVDTANCDSVCWADVRGSMPDLVQAVGRALRMQPGQGEVASLVVPVLLGPGETAENMLTSRAYGGLAKLLEALRAHDARVIEQLAEQQAPSAQKAARGQESGEGGAGPGSPSKRARRLLKFSTPRDHAALTAFINLRVLNPEHQHWRRGIEAARIYTRTHGDLRVPFTYRVPQHDGDQVAEEAESGAAAGWPAALAGFPFGQWIADARRFHTRGDMDPDRITELEKLGMVWNHFEVAWEEGLAAARGWAAEAGHLLAPTGATYQGHPVGIWLKNARAAARKGAQVERRRAEGQPTGSTAGALPEERREQLEDIDPAWCPAWPVTWQRCFHLVRAHLDADGTLPTRPGDVVRQGEDLGAWVQQQRLRFETLSTVQQWMCEHALGIEAATAEERPAPRRTQSGKWDLNYTAAKQFHDREGHLRVPRKHTETITVSGDSGDQEQRKVRLGTWINNQRNRATTLTPERVGQLNAIDMRWS